MKALLLSYFVVAVALSSAATEVKAECESCGSGAFAANAVSSDRLDEAIDLAIGRAFSTRLFANKRCPKLKCGLLVAKCLAAIVEAYTTGNPAIALKCASVSEICGCTACLPSEAGHWIDQKICGRSLHPMAAAMAVTDCNGFCNSGGHGDGHVVGAAPFCEGSCSDDCPGSFCQPWSAGAGCWTGSKVCCCSKP